MPDNAVLMDMDEEGKFLTIHFEYDYNDVQQAKEIPGARFISREKGGPYWKFPSEMDLARRARAAFGHRLELSPRVKAWGEERLETEQELMELALADDGELWVLPDVLPALADTLYPYQRAAVAYGATAPNPLIADQPGLGKTLETIGAIYEAELDEGKHLVIAPLTSLETVWEAELLEWNAHPTYLCTGGSSERAAVITSFFNDPDPAWLILNPAMLQLVGKGDDEKPRFPELNEFEWTTIILDEVHKAGMRDEKSKMFRGLDMLKAQKKFALSGTPMGGKPINLWPILRWLHPTEFTSKWRWADQWLVVTQTGYGKNIGSVRRELQEQFNSYITPYMIRRTKEEVAPQLPPKQIVNVWVEMEPKQSKQYREFALQAEVKIEDESLSATSILAEYTRLKQFSISESEIKVIDATEKRERHIKVVPKRKGGESAKLLALDQLLTERGILDDDTEDNEQVVIFSQFSEVVDWVHEYLTDTCGIRALKITGDTNRRGERKAAQEEFQSEEGSRVIVMTTTAGGVAITLDRADTVIFLDETWVPDDQEQAEDRIHRMSRIHQVTCYYIRCKDTIEEYIFQRVGSKQNVNKLILDLRREGLRAVT